jgi:hypothetical protein
MLLVVSHLRASGQVCCAGESQLHCRPSAPTTSVAILHILTNITSLEPDRFSVQKARMKNQLREFLTVTRTLLNEWVIVRNELTF